MKSQMFIPQKIKAGFKKREGTYTGTLAYLIYWDLTGKLRKEPSWEYWRDKTIDPLEFDNAPTEGFVINRKAGGEHSHFNVRKTSVRVYDPRGFEFEISIPNLVFILENCNCNKGKGLEGLFIYAWEGTELVLIPTSSEEYKKCIEYTRLQSQKVPAKTLVKGYTYINKKQEPLIYLGHFFWHEIGKNYYYYLFEGKGSIQKRHIFQKPEEKDVFVPLASLSSIAGVLNETCVEDYAYRLQEFAESQWSSGIAKIHEEVIEVPQSLTSKQHREVCKSGYEFIFAKHEHSYFPLRPVYNPLYKRNYGELTRDRGDDSACSVSYLCTEKCFCLEDRVLVFKYTSECSVRKPYYKLIFEMESGSFFRFNGTACLEKINGSENDGSTDSGSD